MFGNFRLLAFDSTYWQSLGRKGSPGQVWFLKTCWLIIYKYYWNLMEVISLAFRNVT